MPALSLLFSFFFLLSFLFKAGLPEWPMQRDLQAHVLLLGDDDNATREGLSKHLHKTYYYSMSHRDTVIHPCHVMCECCINYPLSMPPKPADPGMSIRTNFGYCNECTCTCTCTSKCRFHSFIAPPRDRSWKEGREETSSNAERVPERLLLACRQTI